MIFVEIKGELGDQLFQRAFARYLQLETSSPVSIYWGREARDTLREFLLDQFAIQLPIIPARKTLRFIRLRSSKLTRIFFPSSVIHEVAGRPILPVTEQLFYGKKNVVYNG